MIENASSIGAKEIVIPCVDQSSIDNEIENESIATEDYLGVEVDFTYVQPIGEGLKFEVGYQSQFQDSPNTLIFDESFITKEDGDNKIT